MTTSIGCAHEPRSDALPFAPYKTPLRMLVAALVWILIGTAIFFALFAVLAGNQDQQGTLIAASFSGFCGVVASTFWLRRLSGYKIILVVLVAAYIIRLLVGISVYLDVKDHNYFSGNGKYPYRYKDGELYWTYDYTMKAMDIIRNFDRLGPKDTITKKEDKNAEIHYWMGSFMAAGGSRHALDIAPFNAFHHTIAGILVIGLALACGYSLRVALWSGALIAWIPWGFPASYMWRDSVGFAWIVLAIFLLCIGRELGPLGGFLLAIPAAFLAWADRYSYLVAIVAITVLSMVYDRQKSSGSNGANITKFILVSAVVVIGLIAVGHDISTAAFVRHQSQVSSGALMFRLLVMPLLVLRALAGPFPWFVGSGYDTYVLFDYFYHVFQFALFLMFVLNWRQIMSRVTILTYSGAVFWVAGFIAGGVHTAYLALAAPFLVPQAIGTGASLWKFLAISAVCFAIANVVYVSLGLTGSGVVLGVTGY